MLTPDLQRCSFLYFGKELSDGRAERGRIFEMGGMARAGDDPDASGGNAAAKNFGQGDVARVELAGNYQRRDGNLAQSVVQGVAGAGAAAPQAVGEAGGVVSQP